MMDAVLFVVIAWHRTAGGWRRHRDRDYVDAEAVAMNDRERQLWTEYVRQLEARKNAKLARKRHTTKPEPTQAELEAALDDLVREAQNRSTKT